MLSEKSMNNVISILNKELLNEEKIINEKGEKEKYAKKNFYNEICLLLCLLKSKNKLKELLLKFINLLSKKLEKNEDINKKIIREIDFIKFLVQQYIDNKFLSQIEKFLDEISICNNLDIYINNFYLILEMLKDEISNYEKENTENYIEQKEKEYKKEENIKASIKINELNELNNIIIKEQKKFIENYANYIISKFYADKYESSAEVKNMLQKYQNMLNVLFSFDVNYNSLKFQNRTNKFPSEKLETIKKLEEEEEKKAISNNNIDNQYQLISIKSEEKTEIKIKSNQKLFQTIQICFDTLKMFILFHKESYGWILQNFTKIINFVLNFKKDKYVESEEDISNKHCIFILIKYVHKHIKTSNFFSTIKDLCESNIINNFLELDKEIDKSCDISKKSIVNLIEINCLKETCTLLQKIKLPNYNVVNGDIPVNYYGIYFVSVLREFYNSMIKCYEDNFIKETMEKVINEFFNELENYFFHGEKIVDENCLRQFKKDMIFLKKNLNFITIIDLTQFINRINNIMKYVLPDRLRPKNK